MKIFTAGSNNNPSVDADPDPTRPSPPLSRILHPVPPYLIRSWLLFLPSPAGWSPSPFLDRSYPLLYSLSLHALLPLLTGCSEEQTFHAWRPGRGCSVLRDRQARHAKRSVSASVGVTSGGRDLSYMCPSGCASPARRVVPARPAIVSHRAIVPYRPGGNVLRA
jgi:hypothetical protein